MPVYLNNIVYIHSTINQNVLASKASPIVTSSGKTWLMEDEKVQALIRRCSFCASSDQSLDFLSHMNIWRKHFSRFLHNLKTIYVFHHMKKA